jgi:nucleotide-binding universal stress UspA family protein
VSRPSALSRRLLRALLASGRCEVVLVRTRSGREPFRTIVVPVTGTAPSRAAAELAILYARERGARLHLLHAVDPGATRDARALAEQRDVGARMMEEWVERGRQQGVDVRSRLVSSSHPARAIVERAVEERADLLLLGATPRRVGERAYFGPTADRVLADAPCAVAVYVGGVRPEALRAAVPEPGAVTPASSSARRGSSGAPPAG